MSVFVLEPVCTVGWKRGVVAPVAHLSFGSIVPHHVRCLVFMGRTVGVGPGRWVKLFNSIQFNYQLLKSTDHTFLSLCLQFLISKVGLVNVVIITGDRYIWAVCFVGRGVHLAAVLAKQCSCLQMHKILHSVLNLVQSFVH